MYRGSVGYRRATPLEPLTTLDRVRREISAGDRLPDEPSPRQHRERARSAVLRSLLARFEHSGRGEPAELPLPRPPVVREPLHQKSATHFLVPKMDLGEGGDSKEA
jgi:hypothetical protein